MLKRFIPEDHYEQSLDPRNDAPYVFLMQPSRHLISQYYMEKYGCKLVLLGGLYALPQALAKLDKTSPNYRVGFFIGKIMTTLFRSFIFAKMKKQPYSIPTPKDRIRKSSASLSSSALFLFMLLKKNAKPISILAPSMPSFFCGIAPL